MTNLSLKRLLSTEIRGCRQTLETIYTKVAMWLSDFCSSRSWFFSAILSTCLVMIPQIEATIFLDDAMSPEMQKKTGVAGLRYQQKLALEQWLNDNFVQKNPEEEKKDNSSVYLTQNINDGARLQLSDGSVWEVAPQDRAKSAAWILPFPLRIIDNTDRTDAPNYPKVMVNDNTNVGVKVRMVTPPSGSSNQYGS